MLKTIPGTDKHLQTVLRLGLTENTGILFFDYVT